MTETVSRSGRRAALRRDRRRRQRRAIGTALAVLVLVAGGFAVYLALASPEPPARTAVAAATRTQRTLLLQVQAPNGAGLGAALLAHDPPTDTGAAVLIPPQVLVNVAGTGSLPFGRALRVAPPQAVRDAMSDLMGVTVDDGWVLSQPALAALVDAVGGVPVEVDVTVAQGSSVLLSPGQQNLAGPQAVAFLTYLAPGEQEQARLARVQEVLDGLVNALPSTTGELTTVLQRLGGRSISTSGPSGLASFLVGLATDDEAGQLQYDVLPVVDQQAGGAATSFRADPVALRALVDRLLAGSVPPGARAGGNRVLVRNGIGTPGLSESVRARLVARGFVFVGAGNMPRTDYRTTQVLVADRTPQGQALGERVARALGLPGLVIGAQDIGTAADVVVVIGADYRP